MPPIACDLFLIASLCQNSLNPSKSDAGLLLKSWTQFQFFLSSCETEVSEKEVYALTVSIIPDKLRLVCIDSFSYFCIEILVHILRFLLWFESDLVTLFSTGNSYCTTGSNLYKSSLTTLVI